jgi:hypothetical protein
MKIRKRSKPVELREPENMKESAKVKPEDRHPIKRKSNK